MLWQPHVSTVSTVSTVFIRNIVIEWSLKSRCFFPVLLLYSSPQEKSCLKQKQSLLFPAKSHIGLAEKLLAILKLIAKVQKSTEDQFSITFQLTSQRLYRLDYTLECFAKRSWQLPVYLNCRKQPLH